MSWPWVSLAPVGVERETDGNDDDNNEEEKEEEEKERKTNVKRQRNLKKGEETEHE